MPIEKNITVAKKETVEYTPLPENMYQVQLFDVVSESRPNYDTRGKAKNEQVFEDIFNFQFTLLDGLDGSESLRGRSVWANFIPSYLYISTKNGKNKLYQILEALAGRELTQEEEAGFDQDFINSLIGKQCRVGTKNKSKDNKTYTNIETYYSIEAEKEPLTDEEKEKAVVKNKDDKEEKANDDINPDDIPF